MSEGSNLKKLLAALPVILMMTLMRVFITCTVAFFVLVELASSGQLFLGKVAALLTAVVVFFWPNIHYMFREYIRSLQETSRNE